ncbi:hypothetical protein ASG92_09950 [Arthrobacter sp. Soil736]|uniref:hypothetical protein n=1 Tax=Arthrobacter sp. Soil736 TaxID=1736395 RepID=UPI0006FF8313|nr:hypothetical protein [Arthrobacter sp. Soil736]KRE47556.1 hypothetical protein ASG92_09950 [Arthrobacter sp. Soil736]
MSAKNAVGTGALSATPSVTLIVITTYASDSFTRADSSTIGNTPTGGYAWTSLAVKTYTAPTWSILGNALKAAFTSGTTEGLMYVDDTHADGPIEVKLASAGDTGLAFRIADGNNFWMLWTGSPALGNPYKPMKFVAGAYVTVTTTSKNAALNDVLEVTLVRSTVTAFVNGVQVATTTDAFNSTATKHGVRAVLASGASLK